MNDKLVHSSADASIRDVVKRRVAPITTVFTALTSFMAQIVGITKFIGAEYNLLKVRDTLNSESIFRRVADKYQEQLWNRNWKFVGRAPNNVEYIRKRFREIAEVSQIPTQELFERISKQLIVYSNVLLVKVRSENSSSGRERRDLNGKKLQPVAAYFPQPVEYMEIERDVKGKIKSYRLRTNPKVTWRPEDVIHVAIHHQEGYSFGTPMVIPVLADIAALRQVEHSLNILVFQHAIPLLHFAIGSDENEGEADELTDLNTKIQEMPTYGHLVTTNRVKIEVIEAKGQMMDMTPILEYWKTRVLSGLGVSAVGLGEADTSNRGTATTVVSEFQNTATSFQRAVAAVINEHMIKELLAERGLSALRADDRRLVTIHLPEIDLMTLIKRETHQTYLWEHDTITAEELRVELGREPLSDDERKDTYLYRVAIPKILAKAGLRATADTDNRNQPENQHGKKQSPDLPKND